jgi:hypothetical protein
MDIYDRQLERDSGRVYLLPDSNAALEGFVGKRMSRVTIMEIIA